jgi:hypothetical protein
MKTPCTFSEFQNPVWWTPQRQVWIEAGSWIIEERRARSRGDLTEEAFARLVFRFCTQRTEDLEPR